MLTVPAALTTKAVEQLMHPGAERMLIIVGEPAARSELANAIATQLVRPLAHLTELIAPGSDRNAILFFDEADALFGKRAEVADAHAFDPGSGIVLFGVTAAGHLPPDLVRRCRTIHAGL
jgi:SpoVK/Ycf46/Vps4 family AAA+-type ATPase